MGSSCSLRHPHSTHAMMNNSMISFFMAFFPVSFHFHFTISKENCRRKAESSASLCYSFWMDLIVLGVTVADLEILLIRKHLSDRNRLVSGKLFEVVRTKIHLSFSDRLGERNHAVG